MEKLLNVKNLNIQNILKNYGCKKLIFYILLTFQYSVLSRMNCSDIYQDFHFFILTFKASQGIS
jgi:hypothetical protein